MFDRKGLLYIPVANADEETLTLLAIEAGAADIARQDDMFEIICEAEVFSAVSDSLEAAEIEVESKEITRIPSNTVEVDNAETARQVLKLMDLLDDHDDVQNVSANFNIADEVMTELEAEA
jgi:transcriptional/translational regulatory protein YebC/TACO1